VAAAPTAWRPCTSRRIHYHTHGSGGGSSGLVCCCSPAPSPAPSSVRGGRIRPPSAAGARGANRAPERPPQRGGPSSGDHARPIAAAHRPDALCTPPNREPHMTIWPSGLRRCVQVAVWFSRRGLEEGGASQRFMYATESRFSHDNLAERSKGAAFRSQSGSDPSALYTPPNRVLHMSIWPSGLRRCVQVAVWFSRRGFESHG
jgi:hypothetical protein